MVRHARDMYTHVPTAKINAIYTYAHYGTCRNGHKLERKKNEKDITYMGES